MIRIFFLQLIKYQVHGIFIFLIILPDLHGVDKFDECGEILFLYRGLIVDVANECSIQKRLRLLPEGVPALSVSPGVGNQGSDQLQNIRFAVYIGEGVVVHTLFEIDTVENLDAVLMLLQ